MLTRRTFLGNVLNASAGLALKLPWKAVERTNEDLSLRLAEGTPVEIPADFMGLGYEISSVATPNLLCPSNNRYVELVRGLGPKGVLRLGGAVANYARYVANGKAHNEPQDTVITRACLRSLAAFLNELGWRAIWSINFAQGTIDEAIKEARAVRDVLGLKLLAFELGNEVDHYGKINSFRPASYDYDAYRKEYSEWRAAIMKGVPRISFAGPDTGRTGNWVERMAQDANGEVQLLTTHYYRNVQTWGNAEQLLTPNPRLNDVLAQLRTASRQSGIPWRMCEINSFSGGGRLGVSDTIVGTLWVLNTMLLLAQYGCGGVNMETGVNQLGFVSSYSPIQDNGKGLNSAGAPYYGMLAFATAFAAGNQLMLLDDSWASESQQAYVFGMRGKPRSAVIINMDSKMDANVSFASLGVEHARVLRLVAPAVDRNTNVTFGGASVDRNGRWRAADRERVDNGRVKLSPMSAAVLLLAQT